MKKSILDFLVLDKTSDIMTIMLPIKIKVRRIDRNTICSVLENKSEIIKTIEYRLQVLFSDILAEIFNEETFAALIINFQYRKRIFSLYSF